MTPKAIRAHALCVTMAMITEHDFLTSPPHEESLWAAVLRLSEPEKSLPAVKRIRQREKGPAVPAAGLDWPEMPLLGRKVFPSFQVDFERIAKNTRLARGLVAVVWSLSHVLKRLCVRETLAQRPTSRPTHPDSIPPNPPRSLM